MKKLKIILSFIMAAILCLPSLTFGAKTKDKDEIKAPKILAEAAILIDGKTGIMLYGKKENKVMYPASTTKIISFMVVEDAINNGEIALDDMLTFTQEIKDTLDPDGSNIELKVGEKLSTEVLLQGMMIASGNDAATLLAVETAGSEKKFVKRMNEKAEELGLYNTHFTNPHGLTDENHYTTASELAIAAKEAMKSKLFRKIVGSEVLTIAPTDKTEKERIYVNTNNLITNRRYTEYYYDKATGIKTGSTDAAGYCLVASAKDGDRELICVVLKSENSHKDAKALLEYGFAGFKQVELVKKGDLLGECNVKQGADGVDHIRAVASENVVATIPSNASLEDVKSNITYTSADVYAPVEKGKSLGIATYTLDGTVVASIDIVAEKQVDRHPLGFLMSFFAFIWGSTVFRIILYLLLIAVALFIILLAYGFYRSIKKSRSRKRRKNNYRPPMY